MAKLCEASSATWNDDIAISTGGEDMQAKQLSAIKMQSSGDRFSGVHRVVSMRGQGGGECYLEAAHGVDCTSGLLFIHQMHFRLPRLGLQNKNPTL